MLRAAAIIIVLSLLPFAAAQESPLPGIEAPASDDAWARAFVAALPRATRVNDVDGNKLFDDLDAAFARAAPLERVPVIVSFTLGTTTDAGLVRARAAAPDATVERAFHIVPAFAGTMRLDEALAVARLPEVRQIELDRVGEHELDTATSFMGADAVVDAMDVTGRGVAIAVLDTGIHGGHDDFADGKIVHFRDIGADKDTDAFDNGGHGTHVASIAAGLGRADADYRGVAPGAGLVGLKIDGGGAVTSNAIAAYEWVVENKDTYGIRVATMSFGFGIATDGTTALERAVDAAWDAGIVTFKSNGNSGPERSTMTVPAAARGILAIGSMLDPAGAQGGLLPTDQFGFRLSTFSSRGPTADGRVKPDLVAPGQSIMAAQHDTKNGYVAFSGTSMASPFAAGAAALVLEANPALTPDEVREVFFSSAEDWGIGGPDIDYGHGRIQVREAVRLAFAMAGAAVPESEAPVVPFHEVRAGVASLGVGEGTFEVDDLSNPVAATFIGEGILLGAEVRDASGLLVGAVSLDTPGRQLVVSFVPETAGAYAFRVLALPGTAFVVDVSHGAADPLQDILGEAQRLPEGVLPAAVGDGAAVPAPGLLGALAAMGLALVVRRRVA